MSDEKKLLKGGTNKSIAEYYCGLASCSNMVYVYASPKALDPPEQMDFAQETKALTLRNKRARHQGSHWYGFVAKDSNTSHLLKVIQARL